MNRKILFIGLMLFSALVFLAGCSQPEQALPQDPKEAYDFLAQKSKEAGPMRVAYKFTMDFGQQAVMGISSLEMDIEVFMLSQERSKTIVSMSFMGQSINSAVYNLNGKVIQCTEGMLGLGQGLQCQAGSEQQQQMMGMQGTEVKSLDEMFYDYKISFAEDRTLAGRPAKCFLLEYAGKDLKDKSQFGSGMAVASLDNYSFKQEICLDLEHGFASYVDVKTTVYSELSKEEKPGIGFKIEMTSFSTDVSEKDLELPVAFSLGSGFADTECTEDGITLKIIPFKEISGKQATVKIGEISFGQEEMKVEQSKTITIPTSPLFEEKELNIELDETLGSGSKQIEICIDEECQKTNCWIQAISKLVDCASASFSIDKYNKPTYYSELGQVKLIILNNGDMDLDSFKVYSYYSDGSSDLNIINEANILRGSSGVLWTKERKGEIPERIVVESVDCVGIQTEVSGGDIITG